MAKLTVRHPTFDSDGYPAESTCRAIEAWPSDDWPGLFAYFQEAWSDYGRITPSLAPNGATLIRFVTAGWSGNEVLIGALQKTVFWACCWESSHRGGLFILRIPKGKMPDTPKREKKLPGFKDIIGLFVDEKEQA